MGKRLVLLGSVLLIAAALVLLFAAPAEAGAAMLTKTEQLGKMLFFDTNLSLNNNQSCATCHAPEFGFTGPDGMINAHGAVYEGSVPGAFGDRKPPEAAYAGDSPILSYNDENEVWVGGMFWDGRASGWTLGDPLAEQAKGPYLNPVEQAVPDAMTLCLKVKVSSYAGLFEEVYGANALDCDTKVAQVYDQIGSAVATYERSSEVDPFNSKFDRFWDKAKAKGKDVTKINMKNWSKYLNLGLNPVELYGLAVFNDKGQCALCHTLDEGSAGYPLFTDFTYDNLGIPKNPENPIYNRIPDFVDPGLGGFLKAVGYSEEQYLAEWGKFKVPTLRNVDKRIGNTVKAYGHNGYFKSLASIVAFYNTRDVKLWPAPEYAATVNTTELGNLGLNRMQESSLVNFLKTLSDQ